MPLPCLGLAALGAFQLEPFVVGQSVAVGVLHDPYYPRLGRRIDLVARNGQLVSCAGGDAVVETDDDISAPRAQRDELAGRKTRLRIGCRLLVCGLSGEAALFDVVDELSRCGGVVEYLVGMRRARRVCGTHRRLIAADDRKAYRAASCAAPLDMTCDAVCALGDVAERKRYFGLACGLRRKYERGVGRYRLSVDVPFECRCDAVPDIGVQLHAATRSDISSQRVGLIIGGFEGRVGSYAVDYFDRKLYAVAAVFVFGLECHVVASRPALHEQIFTASGDSLCADEPFVCSIIVGIGHVRRERIFAAGEQEQPFRGQIERDHGRRRVENREGYVGRRGAGVVGCADTYVVTSRSVEYAAEGGRAR